MTWQYPSLRDVLAARQRIAPYLPTTPLFGYPALDKELGATVSVKHENHQPIGAFKVRGGVNLVAQLSEDERARGIISASTGNHGQSIAYAARIFGVRAVICVPEGANPVKVAAIESLGAEIVVHGRRDFLTTRERCEALAREKGFHYVHSGNEPDLIAGVATSALEILEDDPATEVIVVPVGGGSGAAGACIVAKAIDPTIRRHWGAVVRRAGRLPIVEGGPPSHRGPDGDLRAEGLATRTAFEPPPAHPPAPPRRLRPCQRRPDPSGTGDAAHPNQEPRRRGWRGRSSPALAVCEDELAGKRVAGRDERRQRQRQRTLRGPPRLHEHQLMESEALVDDPPRVPDPGEALHDTITALP